MLQSNAWTSTTFQLLIAENYEVSVLDWPPVKRIMMCMTVFEKIYMYSKAQCGCVISK